jgi:hypothetical protein
MADADSAPLLLQLPDNCLLAVLQCLAEDATSLCSAARAHSRLHQAVVVALSSISRKLSTQEQVDHSLLPYLTKHGQHVGSIELSCDLRSITLHQLPPMLHLTSLQFYGFQLQLQAGNGLQGLLGCAGLPLKRLRLSCCKLIDGQKGLAAWLSRLPDLEHLSMQCIDSNSNS